MSRTVTRLTFVAAAMLGAVGCGGGTTESGTGVLSVRLTDSPNPIIESATVWISSIYVIGGNDTTGPHFTITSTPQSYDLMTLTDGATAALGSETIPAGEYTQMRLVVDSARLVLKPPTQFSDGTSSRSLRTPSAQQTGIKVVFSEPVNVTPGQTILVVDFDVSRNFVFQGPRSAPHGVSFKPVLHATVQDVAASIAGTVTPASSKASLYAVLSGDTVQTALADTLTGAYILRFLPPGTYSVSAVGTGLSATKSVTVRAGQDTTGVNFP